MTFDLGGESVSLRGGLVAFCGNNLASQDVGGFVYLNAALRKCRHYLATKEQIQEHVCVVVCLPVLFFFYKLCK